jgi:ligand-binding sensor domain-containing protein/signal transduction histidine kinase
VGLSSISTRPRWPSEFSFDHITTFDGLSQSTVYTVVQDRFGLMWFGTADGLNKYDGYEFTIYSHDDDSPGSLSGDSIFALVEDQSGQLWVGTEGGLDRYDWQTDSFNHYRHQENTPNSISHDTVRSILEDNEGTLWVGTEFGLNRYDPTTDTFTSFFRGTSINPGSISNVITTLYEDRQGRLWVGTLDGLLIFDRQSETFSYPDLNLQTKRWILRIAVTALLQDNSGALWIGTDGHGVLRLDEGWTSLDRFEHDPSNPLSLSDNRVWTIFEDSSDQLWLGTDNGLNWFDERREKFQIVRSQHLNPNSLSHDVIYSIFEDHSGVVWIGTGAGGINRLDLFSQRFDHYYSDPENPFSLPDDMVLSIYLDHDNILWVGTEQGLTGFERTTGNINAYRNLPTDPFSLSGSRVLAIAEDQTGNLWIGTENGLNRFENISRTFTHYQNDILDPTSLTHNSVTSLCVDHNGVLWVGTSGGGLNRFQRGANIFRRYFVNRSTPANQRASVISIMDDRQGQLWVGTDGDGLYRFDALRENAVSFRHDPSDPDSISHDRVYSIYEDSSGVIWIGTFRGLNRYEPESQSFSQYRERDGLPSDVVYGILEDKQGALWLSTSNGLARFDPQTETFRNFDMQDGLQSNEFNPNAYFGSSTGELFFGGVNGFNSFTPEQVVTDPFVPPITLTSLTQGGEAMDITPAMEVVEEITITWPNNYFEFEYSALSFSQPQKNNYAYYLDNFDDDWNFVGTQRFGRYTNLPGGQYTLHIIGSNHDGVWNDIGLSIGVTVVPPFWQTWTFRISASLFVLLVVAVGYRYRLKSVETRSRKLEEIVNERTSEIERRRQELEALYRADEEMHRHLELDQVLKALVDVAIEILEAEKCSVLVKDPNSQRLEMVFSRGFSASTQEILASDSYAVMASKVAQQRRPAMVLDVENDPRMLDEPPELRLALKQEDVCSLMYIPILLEDETFGLFNVCYLAPFAFGDDEIRLFSALAQRAALAIENAQLYERTQELAILEERSRLARDLHDAVTQTLFSASLIAEALPELWKMDEEQGWQLLRDLRQLSRGALAEMRSLLVELRPSALVEADLGDLMRQLADAIIGRKGIVIEVQTKGECQVPDDVHVALYRIAQEALNNIVKHAEADRATISLESHHMVAQDGRDCQVVLSIEDDGCGFDPAEMPAERMGLHILKERAEAVGARLQLESVMSKGTKIQVVWEGTLDG